MANEVLGPIMHKGQSVGGVTVDCVDEVIVGDMRPVTSNAVASSTGLVERNIKRLVSVDLVNENANNEYTITEDGYYRTRTFTKSKSFMINTLFSPTGICIHSYYNETHYGWSNNYSPFFFFKAGDVIRYITLATGIDSFCELERAVFE